MTPALLGLAGMLMVLVALALALFEALPVVQTILFVTGLALVIGVPLFLTALAILTP